MARGRDPGDTARYQIFGDLLPPQLAELSRDIAANGIQQPISVDENGNVLDGFQRLRVCQHLGRPCPEVVIGDLDELAKLRFIVGRNKARLTPAFRPRIAATLHERGMSQRDVAELLGVNQSTISRHVRAYGQQPDLPPLTVPLTVSWIRCLQPCP